MCLLWFNYTLGTVWYLVPLFFLHIYHTKLYLTVTTEDTLIIAIVLQ